MSGVYIYTSICTTRPLDVISDLNPSAMTCSGLRMGKTMKSIVVEMAKCPYRHMYKHRAGGREHAMAPRHDTPSLQG